MILKDLLTVQKFGIFTFKATAHALIAEKTLKQDEKVFMIMPTPREISTSCGLAVKVYPEDMEETRIYLEQNKVAIEGIYLIDRQYKGKDSIQPILK